MVLDVFMHVHNVASKARGLYMKSQVQPYSHGNSGWALAYGGQCTEQLAVAIGLINIVSDQTRMEFDQCTHTHCSLSQIQSLGLYG